MFMMINLLLFIILIMIILNYINLFLTKKKKNNHEKMMPIECGFNMMIKFHLPFSIQFYYISILFLIFDIEISLIMPMIQKMIFLMINKWMITSFIIMLILLLGLYLEWWKNLIKWY